MRNKPYRYKKPGGYMCAECNVVLDWSSACYIGRHEQTQRHIKSAILRAQETPATASVPAPSVSS